MSTNAVRLSVGDSPMDVNIWKIDYGDRRKHVNENEQICVVVSKQINVINCQLLSQWTIRQQ